ncbi:MAG: PAS domain-containing sensor histidine kinase [Phycisphaerae bacterium]
MTALPPPSPPVLPTSAAEPVSSLTEQIVEISAIAGGLAHEIRNPLSTLQVNLQLLDEDWRAIESLDPGGGPVDARDVARRSRKRLASLLGEARRLERILDDFLRFVRQRELRATPQDINRVIGELVDFYRPQAEAHRVRLRLTLADHPLVCPVDPSVFKAAVLNLLINAQQAMPDGGSLGLRLSREGPTVARIDVIDSGPGIPSELQDKVFDAYYSTKKSGSGLGLAQTRQMIRQHGGRIHLFSESGRGSCFTILLPIRDQHAAEPAGSGTDRG